MPGPDFIPSFPHYLAAKKTVDDRALNGLVWQTLFDQLVGAQAESPLRVLEIGAGIGTMFERLVERGMLHHAHYTALDALPENITAARSRLRPFAKQSGLRFAELPGGKLQFTGPESELTLQLVARDLFDFIEQQRGFYSWDLLIAHAFLDLIDIPAALPHLFDLLRPGGYFYFTINYDGATLFEPPIDPDFDQQIEVLYHRTMDERSVAGKPSGDSRAGRHLFKQLPAAGAVVLAAGASDWVVYPGSVGYPAEEAYFLHFIIDTLDRALYAHPALDAARFAAWIAERHAQIERHELVYIAHQIDFTGRYPGSDPAAS